ncbi:hypothetical protein BV25DRAFT_1910010 [Artomyces pyxidatus]|uniref:Uncharacterized protein n=1 Tax=Artomyces pyxidatus TaxID=48021 RepID=A0ACB8SIL1_9AGAM|nr:hypothetical protein BV25DRAFT_1910010 [Artomyces pyxidatus]
MDTFQPLTTRQVQEAAKEVVSVGGETLTISKSYLWRNDQPRIMNPATGEEERNLREPRAANIAVTLQRTNKSTNSDNNLESSVLPHLTAIHVIRANQPLPNTPGVDDLPPDAPMSAHFAWSAPPSLLSSLNDVEVQDAAYEGAFFIPQTMDGGNSLSLNAWNGPAWGSLRNGIDDMIDYNTVVEFEGGVFLKSGRERMQVVL